MQQESGYNGWANYETWACDLWLTNSEQSYNYFREQAKKIQDIGALADLIRNEISEQNPLGGQASLYSDLLNSAIGQIDFVEIAESFREE